MNFISEINNLKSDNNFVMSQKYSSIRSFISEINRNIDNKVVIVNQRLNKNIDKSIEELRGIYISDDGFIEIICNSGLKINIKINSNLGYEKIDNEIYKIYDRKTYVLIVDLNMQNIELNRFREVLNTK